MTRALAPGFAILAVLAFFTALMIYGPVYLWGESVSGRPCVAYEVEIRSPVFGEEGELVHRASAHLPLTLRGEDGTVAILLQDVATDVALEPDRRGDTRDEPNEGLVTLFDEEKLSSTVHIPHDDYLWSEGVVRDGDRVTVYGRLTPEPETTSGYRKGTRRLIIEAPAEGQVVVATADA